MQFDLTKPNTGRIIDYWMGGKHNFEIDRQLADKVAGQFPIVPEIARDARAMIKRAVPWMYARGIRHILDFGASLPTCENTHLIAQVVDPTIKVVYSDIDPVTVAYGQELLQNDPNVIYLQCNANDPRPVLDSPQTLELLGGERRVGIIFLSLAHSMSDVQVRQSWQTLYDWVAPGSYLFMNASSERWDIDPDLVAVAKMYASSNIIGRNRRREEYEKLVSPWKITEEGIAINGGWGLPPPAESMRAVNYSMMVFK